MNLNNILQWSGTACLLVMYVLMSFFPEQRPWNIVAGVAGGAFYLAWTIRVANRPQMIVNAVAICIGIAGVINFEPVVTAPIEGSVKADQYERDMKPDCVDPKERT